MGPLFPTKRYTLLNSMAISVGCYMGIVILTTLLIFPETMSHAAMDTISAQLERLAELVRMQDDAVLATRPEDLASLIARFKALRARVVATQQQRSFHLTAFGDLR